MSYLQEDRLGHRSDSNSGCAIRADADFRVDDPVAVLLEFFSARILLCYLGLTLSGRHSKVEPLSGVVFLPLTSSEVGTRQLKDRSSDEANPLPWKKTGVPSSMHSVDSRDMLQ